MYSIQALYSAYQLNLPITFVIINNQKYEALRSFGHTFGMQKVVGTDLAGLDFCALAKGHGLPAGKQVTDADTLDKALAASFRAKGPTLIEVMVY
jgi:benzoylformate decarboxylase